MQSYFPDSAPRNSETPRDPQHPRTLRLIYRRDDWALTTSAKYKRFDSIRDVQRFLNRLRERRALGIVRGRLEERDGQGRWHDLPVQLWAESGWGR